MGPFDNDTLLVLYIIGLETMILFYPLEALDIELFDYLGPW